MNRFYLRDLFWLTAVVAAFFGGYGWHSAESAHLRHQLQIETAAFEDLLVTYEKQSRQIDGLESGSRVVHEELIALRGALRQMEEQQQAMRKIP